MRSFRFVMLLSLAGCPPPPQYYVADVISSAARAPVEDALVAADCGRYEQAARRTDDRGRARLTLGGKVDPAHCTVTVAKPGYHSVETAVAATCTDVTACPPTLIWVDASEGAP